MVQDKDKPKAQLISELAELRRRFMQLSAVETAHKEHLEAAEYERRLMAILMNNIPDAIYFKDIESRFTRITKSQAIKFGLDDPAQAAGKTDFDFFTAEHAQQAYDDEQRIIKTGLPLVGMIEKETWSASRETWVSTTKMPLQNEKGEIVGTFGISRDITERKRMEEALEEHARLLEQANADLAERNRELDEFAYFASHDLQEPLRKLVAFSEVLEQDMAKGDEHEVRADLETLTSAAKRMQRLVQDLLALSRSRRQDMHWQETTLGDCVDRALDALELRIRETNAHIQRDPLPVVQGDPSLLAQLYQNLIGNALKFHGEKPPHIKVSAEEAADEWILTVADKGIGIEPDYAKQIFLPFKRLHRRDEYEGTGIGLAICLRIVERHGGRIWVESELGYGARFRFTIGKSQDTGPA